MSIVTKCYFRMPDRGKIFPWKPLGIAHLKSNEIVSVDFCRRFFVSAANKSYPAAPPVA